MRQLKADEFGWTRTTQDETRLRRNNSFFRHNFWRFSQRNTKCEFTLSLYFSFFLNLILHLFRSRVSFFFFWTKSITTKFCTQFLHVHVATALLTLFGRQTFVICLPLKNIFRQSVRFKMFWLARYTLVHDCVSTSRKHCLKRDCCASLTLTITIGNKADGHFVTVRMSLKCWTVQDSFLAGLGVCNFLAEICDLPNQLAKSLGSPQVVVVLLALSPAGVCFYAM